MISLKKIFMYENCQIGYTLSSDVPITIDYGEKRYYDSNVDFNVTVQEMAYLISLYENQGQFLGGKYKASLGAKLQKNGGLPVPILVPLGDVSFEPIKVQLNDPSQFHI